MNTPRSAKSIVSLALKAAAVGMAALSVALTLARFATTELYVIVLAVGLFSLAVASLSDYPVR